MLLDELKARRRSDAFDGLNIVASEKDAEVDELRRM
jgi:hypothetical protein